MADLLRKPGFLLLSRMVLGVIFVYASIDKIIHPLAFAQVIHFYRLSPPETINFIAVIMPWIELVAGLLLLIGYRTRAAALVINAMLIFFAVVMIITAARGINVACGCFSTSSAVKSNLAVRVVEDLGMLLVGLHIFSFSKKSKPEAPKSA